MKNIYIFLIFLFLLVTSSNSFSQSTVNYTFSTTTTGSLVDMSSGTTQLVGASQDDTPSGVTSIGFDFWFMGVRNGQFSASSNGAVRLGSTVIGGTAYGSTFPVASQSILAPFWGDLGTSSTGKVHYKVTGSAPNRVLVIEFLNMAFDYSSLTVDATYQILISETTNNIEFRYGYVSCGVFTNAPIIAVGISSNSTANNYVSVDQDALTSSTTVVSNKSYAATGEILQFSSASDGTRRTILFTAPAGPVAPSALNFTSVTAVAMTLNWTDNSGDETGFGIYRSTDGGATYLYITKTAANVVTYAATSLSPGTTYTWAVYAVTEVPSSTAASGSQATVSGTISGTKSVGPTGDYLTLTAAITDIKLNFLAGATILELQAAYTSAGETYPLDFSALGSTSSNTLTVRPATGATALSITGGNTTALITISAGYIMFDGRPGGLGSAKELTVANTSLGPAIRFINDGNNSTLQYLTITSIPTSTTSGVILFSTAATGIVGNSNNTISFCNITKGATNPANLIYSSGTAAVPNISNVISNCNLFEFSNAGVNVAATGNGTGWNVSSNNIYNSISVATTQTGILFASATSTNTLIENNIVGGSAAGGTGTWGNTGSVIVTGIAVTNGAATINNNTVTNIYNTSTGTAARVRGINMSPATTAGTLTVSNNQINNLQTNGATTGLGGGSGGAQGIIFGPTGFQSCAITNNTIHDISMENTSANTVACFAGGIQVTNSLAIVTRNTIYAIKNKATGTTANNPPIACGFIARFMNTGAYVANNMISLGTGEATNTAFVGMLSLSAGAVTHPYFYNSVYIGGTAGGTWSSMCFGRADYTAVAPAMPIQLYNNILFMDRTGGGSTNYAVGNMGTAATTVAFASDYNLLYNSATSNIALWDVTSYDFAGYRTISVDDEIHSLSPAAITEANLFTASSTGNLHIITGNSEAWYPSGNGVQVTGISTDFDGNSRSETVAGGTVDIGADEFTASGTPPMATESAAPAVSTTTTYSVGGNIIASITWGAGGTPPTSMALTAFTGAPPPNAGAYTVGNVYWIFTPTGGSGYSYDVTFNYADVQIGAIDPEADLRLCKSDDGGVSYTPYLTGGTGPGQYELNTTNNTIKVYGLTGFSHFSITDDTNPLPVELSSFTSNHDARNVNLNWSTTSELNNSGFDIERKLVSETVWSRIGNVAGHGTSNTVNNYQYEDRNLQSGKYNYRLKQIDANGNFKYYQLSNFVEVGIPGKYAISQNYPNPFNPSTKINYDLPFDSRVAIKIFDITGREVASILNQTQTAGYYTATFNASNLSSGVYFYQINADGGNQNFVKTLKMMLIK